MAPPPCQNEVKGSPPCGVLRVRERVREIGLDLGGGGRE